MIYDNLLNIKKKYNAGYFVLIDPDIKNEKKIFNMVSLINNSRVDGILIGGSLIMDNGFNKRAKEIKKLSKVPVILFPGSSSHLNKYCDAILFMSIISGRNPTYLIGEHVIAAPIIKGLNIEPIPTGYMIFESKSISSVDFMSGSKPLPKSKPDIAAAHALAGQYLGMKMIYLEGGSGVEESIPNNVIAKVNEYIDIPIIVGGGIKDPQTAALKVKSGASFIVTGTLNEQNFSISQLNDFADAIHGV